MRLKDMQLFEPTSAGKPRNQSRCIVVPIARMHAARSPVYSSADIITARIYQQPHNSYQLLQQIRDRRKLPGHWEDRSLAMGPILGESEATLQLAQHQK